MKHKITAKKYMGDDAYSWAVFVDGHPVVTGLGRSEVAYYKDVVKKELADPATAARWSAGLSRSRNTWL